MKEVSSFQSFIYKSRYARWQDNLNRREDFPETVDRYLSFSKKYLKTHHNYSLPNAVIEKLRQFMLNQDGVPSMRALMAAGPALDRCNVASFNCSFLPVNSPRSFDECLYILMCGTGVGFSVELHDIEHLPIVNEHFENSDTTVVVQDSKAGWARALRELISLLYAGQKPKWNLSKLRPAGARLKTFGGRSSGPEPLNDLFNFTSNIFLNAKGRKLTSIECHDIMCKIGEVVVVGGVRRSALISLSDLSDVNMRSAKSGEWWRLNPHRALANNSAVYNGKPDMGVFIDEWKSLFDSKSGERGIFNRDAARATVARSGRRESDFTWGTNPCSEILLRPFQFCNLSEAVARERDNYETLAAKIEMATILGTIQSCFTKFRYLRKIWANNTEEERLLGVSLTGILDCKYLREAKPADLEKLKQVAINTNKEWSKKLGINISTAITCVKPSGTVSQWTDSASGIHPRHSKFYIRSVRGDKKDPLSLFLQDQGVTHEDCVLNPSSTTVFYFPCKAPEGSVLREDITAIEHLNIWLKFARHWCEHKPSITVSVKEDEWMEVGAWVYKHFDEISGISFLPYDGGSYKQAPYQECTEQQYTQLLERAPVKLDWALLSEYEKEDTTTGSQELACTGGVCEIVDIGVNN